METTREKALRVAAAVRAEVAEIEKRTKPECRQKPVRKNVSCSVTCARARTTSRRRAARFAAARLNPPKIAFS